MIQIGLEYDDGDDVEGIVSNLAGRTEVGLPRRGPVADQAPLVLAGGISSQLLAIGLVKWIRSLKGMSIYVEIRAKSDVFRVFKGQLRRHRNSRHGPRRQGGASRRECPARGCGRRHRGCV